jgi:hypothetical protein
MKPIKKYFTVITSIVIILSFIQFNTCLRNNLLSNNSIKNTLLNKVNTSNNTYLKLFSELNSNKNNKINNSLKFLDKNSSNELLRDGESMKKIAFIFAKAYLENFASNQDRIEIIEVSDDKAHTLLNTNPENLIKRYLFSNKTENKGKFKFKVCVPIDKKEKPFIDLFCPFDKCDLYSNFLKTNLTCLRIFSDQTSSKLFEISKKYSSAYNNTK